MSTINRVAHGLTAGQRVRFSDIAPDDTGLDPEVVYFVITAGLVADAFQISETDEGDPLVLDLDVTSANMQVVPEETDSSPAIAITAAAATDLFAATAHGLVADDTIFLTELTGGTGLAEDTLYYILAAGLTADAFAVSLTSGGAAVDITTDLTAGFAVKTAVYVAVTDTDDVHAPPVVPSAPAAPTLASVIQGGVVRLEIEGLG